MKIIRMKKRRLKMKRKTLTLTLVLLSCLALIGVGFASWIISANTTKEVEGNISVDTVTDNRLTVDTEWTTKSSVIFGWKNLEGIEKPWLKNSDMTELTNNQKYAENLTITLKVTVKDAEGKNLKNAATDGFSAKIEISDSTQKTNYEQAVTDKLVGQLPTANIEHTETGIYLVSFTFTWGSAFGGETPTNPYIYYNQQTYSESIATEASTNLKKLEKLKDIQFKITLTVTPAETTSAE